MLVKLQMIGLKTYIGFYDKNIIRKILKNNSKPDAIVASSVITHLENPIEFVKIPNFS